MQRTDDRLLPVLLLAAQAAVWPGAALLRGVEPSAAQLLAAALTGGPVTMALAARRARPVLALLVVVTACALGAGPLPVGAVTVLGTGGVALALLSVAVERDTTTALLCVVTLEVWQALHGITLHGLGQRDGLDLLLTTLLYAAACGTGLHLRRVRAARDTAERRLRRAESERDRLPATERRRMERELHDVSAHHLTAVVVTCEAALGLREHRPELAREALVFAADTGREVGQALSAVRSPQPTAEDGPASRERLNALVNGFRSLGQPVTGDIRGLPGGFADEVVYAIVREALTNAVRHAFGAPTTVRCTHDDHRTEVIVRNGPVDPPAGTAAPGAGLGGGRGRTFLRGRAREAGGTLSSGPTADGGWEVRALLPGRVAGPPRSAVPRTYQVAQFAAAVGLCLQPLLPVLVVRADDASSGSGISPGVLFALLATAQAVSLLWLRRAPRTVLVALAALAALWPAAMAVSGYAGPVVLPPLMSMIATCTALVVLASRAPSDAGTEAPARPAAPVALAVVHAAAATVAVLLTGRGAGAVAVAGLASAGAGLAAGAAWWTGVRYGRRERAVRNADDDRLATWTGEAVRDAWAERRRITAGLETTVLARTADVVDAAEAGRLAETAHRARDALAAMRALLDSVREGAPSAELRPQPTLEALDLLAQQCRAGGREVEVRRTARVPQRLPAAVDLAAYRAAETLLAAGGDGPTSLVLDAADGVLSLTATGAPHAARPAVRERLAAHAAALGGSLSTSRPDTALLRLPLGPMTKNADRIDETSDTGAPAPERGDEEGPRCPSR
ncbi:histidine kinase [Streptomyces sp. NPDC052069]|uniref:ATP-binding protein n=1 Tax=Streptomyces sp. NPDC052069 TaxID=3154650 RepID=UPI00343175D2